MTQPTASIPTQTTVQLPTTVGMDISDRVSHYLVQRGDGSKLAAGKVKMTREHLRVVVELETRIPLELALLFLDLGRVAHQALARLAHRLY